MPAGFARAVAVLTTTLLLYVVGGVAPAAAHVHVSSPGAVRGSTAILTFEVPNESRTGSATTQLSITLPNISARAETMAGWAVALDRDAAAGTVRSVTWTAAAGGGIGADQYGAFRIRVKLPDADEVSFPAVQTYADGTVVHWDQPPLPDGGEPEHPAPMLTLAAESAPVDQPVANPAATSSDNGARWLAGAALLVAAAGVALALARRRA